MKHTRKPNPYGTYGTQDVEKLIDIHNELLEACRESLVWLKDNDEGNTGVAVRLQQAIAKAEGTN